ncbi:hypothetical protein BKK81_20240 [Cupriavidus sp. USMAHM13]|nr:hypothetical protein BKK81_20240 [Cupriavidus sp. USMAHM13]
MLELRALLPGGGNDSGRIQVEQVVDEFVGVPGLDAERCQCVVRKVFPVEGDDDAGAATNGGGEYVPVVWVR